MADNIELSAGSGGAVLSTDEVTRSTVVQHVQYVKLMNGTDAAVDVIPGDATNGLDVDVTRSALPTGASTSANQTTIIGHLDGVEGLLTTLAGAVAGTEVQADVLTLPALPAGTNNIGDVDVLSIAAGDNNIGNVDVVTVPADPFGANADAASATGSISAKLRFIASTGIPVTGTVTVGSHAVTNAGTFATQESGAALTALQLIDNASIADDAAFTPATTGVTMAGFTADETATDSVDEGDGGAARMTLDRKQIITPYVHAAAGGWTPHKNLDVDETEDDIKTAAGKLGWIHVMNRSTGVRYIKFYNATAANVTVGTTTPVLSFPVPTMADTNGAGFCINFGDAGVQFDTAICVAATTGVADNDTGAPGTNDIVLNCGYA